MQVRSPVVLALAALLAACGPHDGKPDSGQMPLEQCVLGWWQASVPHACGTSYCGLGPDVPECQQSDCQELGFMKLESGGNELQGDFAVSQTSKTLSAPTHNQQPLTWGLTSAGKIFLASNSSQPQSVTCDATTLVIAGVSGWQHPAAGIASALQKGADTNQWVSIPIP